MGPDQIEDNKVVRHQRSLKHQRQMLHNGAAKDLKEDMAYQPPRSPRGDPSLPPREAPFHSTSMPPANERYTGPSPLTREPTHSVLLPSKLVPVVPTPTPTPAPDSPTPLVAVDPIGPAEKSEKGREPLLGADNGLSYSG